jgi:hypothetical protein
MMMMMMMMHLREDWLGEPCLREVRNAYRILVEKPENKTPFVRLRTW